VSIHWAGLLDWTTGPTHNGVKVLFQPFQYKREANHVYSADFFVKFAALAVGATLLKSVDHVHIILISYNENIRRAVILN